MKKWFLVGLAALGIGLLTGCQSSAPDHARDEVGRARLGVVLPLTGAHGAQGTKILAGIECAMEKLRRDHFPASEIPELVKIDDRGRDEEAAKAVQSLAASGAAGALVGYLSSEALAVKTVAAQLQFPVLTPAGSNEKIVERNPYMFQANFRDDMQARALAYYARYIRRCGRLAVMMNIDEGAVYSRDLAGQVGYDFRRYGGEVVRVRGFRESETDFRIVLKELLAAAPDVIFIPAYSATAGRIVNQARELGFTGLLLGSDGWNGSEFLEHCGPKPGMIAYSAAYSPRSGLPEQEAFAALFEELNGYAPDVNEALGYDAGLMMAIAMRKSRNSDDIIGKLRDIRLFIGSGSEITVQPEGDVSRSVYIHTLEPGVEGKLNLRLLKVVSPAELKRLPLQIGTD